MSTNADPIMAHVDASMRKTLREMYLNQPIHWKDNEKEISRTLTWFDRAFDEMRGFEITIISYLTVEFGDTEEEDEEVHRHHINLSIGVADQVDVEFMLGADEDSVAILRRRIHHMLSGFEVLDNGVSMSILKHMDQPRDLDRIFIAGGTVAFGFDPEEEDAFRMEISTTPGTDLSTGKPYHVRLIY
jgi:hypothetical protein